MPRPWRCRSLLWYALPRSAIGTGMVWLTERKTGRTPTKSTSEASVGMANEGMPWESGSSEGKYQYHPGGDTSIAPKDAPSAINVVVIPDVNLPKVHISPLVSGNGRSWLTDTVQHLHEKYNKWGKDGY